MYDIMSNQISKLQWLVINRYLDKVSNILIIHLYFSLKYLYQLTDNKKVFEGNIEQ